MSKFISYLQIFLPLILLLTCEKSEYPLASTNTVEGPMLFARYYINYAWGYQYSGWYVDKMGQIYEVDENTVVKLIDIDQDTIFSEKMMNGLLQYSSKTTRQIDEHVLSEMKKLIAPASLGQLSEAISVCRDFGASCYFTFIMNQEGKGYKEILLFQAGDWAQKNLSPEAFKLYMLLRANVEGDTTQLPCSP
jgi:hypothetical protein